ncbi:MAG TPA: hypothetical protein VML36_01090 [Nitrospiria bacterium]|nr:hypothetical protein [Nitrospiria bacterium]
MKKLAIGMLVVAGLLAVVGTSWAATVMGELTKIDEKKSFYFIKDDKGKVHKVHVDATTKKTGDIKVGAQVTVDEAKGHAKSIEVMEMKK